MYCFFTPETETEITVVQAFFAKYRNLYYFGQRLDSDKYIRIAGLQKEIETKDFIWPFVTGRPDLENMVIPKSKISLDALTKNSFDEILATGKAIWGNEYAESNAFVLKLLWERTSKGVIVVNNDATKKSAIEDYTKTATKHNIPIENFKVVMEPFIKDTLTYIVYMPDPDTNEIRVHQQFQSNDVTASGIYPAFLSDEEKERMGALLALRAGLMREKNLCVPMGFDVVMVGGRPKVVDVSPNEPQSAFVAWMENNEKDKYAHIATIIYYYPIDGTEEEGIHRDIRALNATLEAQSICLFDYTLTDRDVKGEPRKMLRFAAMGKNVPTERKAHGEYTMSFCDEIDRLRSELSLKGMFNTDEMKKALERSSRIAST
ncbi:MAG: hypothetical protein ABW189_09150 [Rickettsiales bacterium]